MKGLFECLRNRVYREDEDILQQIAANAAIDDSEIESLESDDEDEDDELFDFSGLDLDEIDDADIERATNEFNMNEGDRAACRIRTIDLKEDAVELQPETKLRKKISLDPDGRDFVGAGDGSGHDMQNEDVLEETVFNNSHQNKMQQKRKLVQGTSLEKPKPPVQSGNFTTKPASEMGDKAAKKIDMKKVGAHVMKHKGKYAAGAAAAGVAAYGGKKLYDKIKAKKAKEVAIEEGISLEEAYAFIEDCENDLLAEGFTYEEIYGEDNVELQPEARLNRRVSADDDMREFVGASKGPDDNLKTEDYDEDLYDEDNVELQPETKLNKRISNDDDMREFVGAGDGSGHDLRSEAFELIMEEVMDEIDALDEGLIDKMGRARDNRRQKRAALRDAKDFKKDALNREILRQRDAVRKIRSDADHAVDEEIMNRKAKAREVKRDHRHMEADIKQQARERSRDIWRERKAKKYAMEEGVTLDEALAFVIECEQDLLDEGYEIEEIYGEDNVELQPETKLNKRVSADDDMREFVGASEGPDDNLKTEAMSLALEEGITLGEAMEIIEEGLRDKVRATKAAKKARKARDLEIDDKLERKIDDVYGRQAAHERETKAEWKRRADADLAYDNQRDAEWNEFEDEASKYRRVAKRKFADSKAEYKKAKKEIWRGKKEDAVDDAIEKLSTKGVNNGVFPNRLDLQDEMYDEDADECAPKRQQQKPVGDVTTVSVDGVDTDDELMLGVEAVIREIEESFNDYDM